jgi:hypothetical protein
MCVFSEIVFCAEELMSRLPVFDWKYSFARLVSDVITVTSSESVSYTNILRCEKDLREHHVPLSLQWPPPKYNTYETMGKSFQRCCSTMGQHIGK